MRIAVDFGLRLLGDGGTPEDSCLTWFRGVTQAAGRTWPSTVVRWPLARCPYERDHTFWWKRVRF